MSQAGNVYLIASASRTDFTGTLAQDAGAVWHPALPAALGGRSIVRSLVIQSVQNLDWELLVFKMYNGGTPQSIPPGGTIDSVLFAGKYRFFAADAVRIAGAGPYLYYIDGLEIPYHDIDSANASGLSTPPFFNAVLVNRSVTGKAAGDAGAVIVRVGMEGTNA